MPAQNRIYIATSLDGFIADRNGGLAWLENVDNPEGDDMGYGEFMENTDALLMGRTTFETVCGFDVDWPYTKPVYVLSNSLTDVPAEYEGKVWLVKGALPEVLQHIHERGHYRLYVDGGQTITNFLAEGLIDEMIITVFPILLGGGHRLFGALPEAQNLELVGSKVCVGKLVQSHYRRKE
jgi:dihydrofolate reductase